MPDDCKRRWFQFKLRTLLIVVAILAVNAGIWKAFGPPIVLERLHYYDGPEFVRTRIDNATFDIFACEVMIAAAFLLPRGTT